MFINQARVAESAPRRCGRLPGVEARRRDAKELGGRKPRTLECAPARQDHSMPSHRVVLRREEGRGSLEEIALLTSSACSRELLGSDTCSLRRDDRFAPW